MNDWWRARSPREQGLIVIAAVLLGAVIYWQALLGPLQTAARNAERRHADAVADLRAIERAEATISARPASAPQPSSVRARLRDAAAAGLTLARMQPEPGGAVTVWFEPAQPALVFAWFAELSREHGIEATRVAVERAGDGRIQVQATFTAGDS